MARKIKKKEGDVFQIELEGGGFAFGRVLVDPLCAFYDLKQNEIPDVERIIESEILFKIWVMNHAFWHGRWKIMGNVPLDESLREEPYFSKIDRISGEMSLYHIDSETPATKEQLKGLERAAVWEPEHVEGRLVDHYENRPNIWVERFKIDC